MRYGLPKTVEIDGEEFAIRYDYRVILDLSLIHISRSQTMWTPMIKPVCPYMEGPR